MQRDDRYLLQRLSTTRRPSSEEPSSRSCCSMSLFVGSSTLPVSDALSLACSVMPPLPIWWPWLLPEVCNLIYSDCFWSCCLVFFHGCIMLLILVPLPIETTISRVAASYCTYCYCIILVHTECSNCLFIMNRRCTPQCVTKKRERGKGGRGRKAVRKPKGTLRELAQQHRPTQNMAEAEKAYTSVRSPAMLTASLFPLGKPALLYGSEGLMVNKSLASFCHDIVVHTCQ
jgi:hypothetical protein